MEAGRRVLCGRAGRRRGGGEGPFGAAGSRPGGSRRDPDASLLARLDLKLPEPSLSQGFTRGSERSFQRAGQVFPRYMCVCLFTHCSAFTDLSFYFLNIPETGKPEDLKKPSTLLNILLAKEEISDVPEVVTELL